MKTTLEMPDGLYRKLKAHAASRGLTVRQIVTEAVTEKLSPCDRQPRQKPGWLRAFGIAPGTAEEINRIVEEEFERIDPEDWK